MFPYAIENPAPQRKDPIVGLIVANVLFFAAELMFPAVLMLAFVPARWTFLPGWFGSQFLHAGFEHIFGNMYALWLFGPEIAALLGWWFLPFYLAGGCAAAGLHLLADPGSRIPLVGASGAISALMGAYVVRFPNARLKFYRRGIHLSGTTFTLSALVFIVIYVLLQGMGIMGGGGGGVAHWAHLGGLIFGAAAINLAPSVSAHVSEAQAASASAVRAAMARGDDAAAALAWAAAVEGDPSFALSSAAEQVRAAGALYRGGRAHLAHAALAAVLRAEEHTPDTPRALLMMGDLELARFKEFAVALERYRSAAAHPQAEPEVKKDAQNGMALARAALSQDSPDGASAMESCSVLYESTWPLSDKEIAAVEAAAGTTVGRRSGYLLRGVSGSRAVEAAAALERAGVPAVVIPEKKLLRLSPPVPAEQLAVDEAGVTLSGPRPVAAGWEKVLLACVTWVGHTVHEAEMPGLLDVETDDEVRAKKAVFRCDPRLDVVLRDGSVLRWRPEDPAAGAAALRGFVDAVSWRAPGAHLCWGARALLEGEQPEAQTFEDDDGADQYVAWQAQLARLKSEHRYGRAS